MKALVLNEYKSLVLQEEPAPAITPNEVLIRVHSCGICGSDVHGFDGSSGRRIPPVIMGHEASGVIAEIGADVEIEVYEGDHGWTVPDSPVYNQAEADRAWVRLLALYEKAL